MDFAGWTPTATGRLSFSRIGGEDGSHNASVCNRTDRVEASLFGAEIKTSPDGPIHPFLLSRSRIADAHYLTFLRVKPDALPFPDGEVPSLRLDPRGGLEGQVLVIVSDRRVSSWFHDWFAGYTRLCRRACDPHLSDGDVASLVAQAESNLADLWHRLIANFRQDPRSAPAFAKATVKLSRTGKTKVHIDPEDLFTTAGARSDQIKGGRVEEENAQNAGAVVARQVFHFVRDLAHRHYHHDPRADLTTTTFPWSATDDETWRRETHYGLIRMAISVRREDDVESYKQALGILAYAESFQTHLTSWVEKSNKAVKRTQYFPYDFSALRISIAASLSQIESRRDNSREARTFAYVIALTALGIIVEGGHVIGIENFKKCLMGSEVCTSSGFYFWWMIDWFVKNPWWSIIVPTAGAILLGVSRRKLLRSNTAISAWRGGIGRLTDAIMAEIARKLPTDVAWFGGVGAVALMLLAQVIAAAFFMAAASLIVLHGR